MEQEKRRLQLKPLAIFVVLAVLCVGAAIAGQMFFPGAHVVPRVIRTLMMAGGTIALAVGSERLLRRQIGPEGGLGLLHWRKAALGIPVGTAGAVLFIGVIAGVLWIFARFHFERGELNAAEGLMTVETFFWSNIGEELIFRGYLLIVLARAFGMRAALASVALLFGLFHLPGLSGWAALKMVLTTGACSYLFSAAFLATGTLWTAIALHFFGNVVLHKITGLSGGSALLKPEFDGAYPPYDPGFWVCFLVPLLLTKAIFLWKGVKENGWGIQLCGGRW